MDEIEPEVKKEKRGRETLFRATYQSQNNLIQVADNKANMIISINTMIISSIIAITGYGAVADKLAEFNIWMLLPLSLIVLSCMLSAILAIQAAKPMLIKPWTSDNNKDKSSLLFFGRIASYSQEAYLKEIKNLLNSGSDLYEHMAIDLHNQGRILTRKYNLLVYAYQVFMFGFVLSVVAFLIFLAIMK